MTHYKVHIHISCLQWNAQGNAIKKHPVLCSIFCTSVEFPYVERRMSAQSTTKTELIQSIKYLTCTFKIIKKFFELLRPFFERKKKPTTYKSCISWEVNLRMLRSAVTSSNEDSEISLQIQPDMETLFLRKFHQSQYLYTLYPLRILWEEWKGPKLRLPSVHQNK